MQGNFQKSMEICNEANQFLLTHQIAPTPNHYAVIYCYFSNENAVIKQKIDQHLAAEKTLDGIFIDALYSEFLSNSQQVEDTVFTPFEDALNSSLAQIDNQVSSEQEAMSNLHKIEEALNRLGEFKPLQSIINFLLSAIGQSQEQHKSLSSELNKASKEVGLLKNKLEESRQEALIDTLTGLLNRRGCDKRLQELSLSNIHSSMVIDIDHFKNVNDSFGHSVGDKVIQLVAKTIRDHIADDDIPVRYGGEEFVVILSNKTQNIAHKTAEKIRNAISTLKLVQRKSNTQLPSITVSIGIAELKENMSWPALFNNADQALYQAKNSGRNCCVLSTLNSQLELEKTEPN